MTFNFTMPIPKELRCENGLLRDWESGGMDEKLIKDVKKFLPLNTHQTIFFSKI